MPVSVWVSTSSGGADVGGGAIACVEIAGEAASIDGLMTALGLEPVVAGTVRRRKVPLESGSTFPGAAETPIVDDAVIGRWCPGRATVMTHGGRAVVDGFVNACRSRGASVSNPVDLYPEAGSNIESSMLAVLAQAASPAAVDLLLDQPRRWIGLDPASHMTDDRDRLLKRLIVPSLVVAVGPPNIGKSSLLNALAGRRVAVVADEPGTTRDHVGALIDLQGVVVRWVDTPGMDEPARGEQSGYLGGCASEDDQIQNEAQRLAAEVAAQADVVVACEDAATSTVVSDRVQALRIKDGAVVVRVGLRADLHAHRRADANGALLVSSLSGEGMSSLVAAVREAVVPAMLLEDGLAWRFWEG